MTGAVKVHQAAAARALAATGIETAALDARLLMARALGVPPDDLWRHGERAMTGREVTDFEAMLARRRVREPVAYILGEREFWSLPIGVDRSVLVPRPDSETVIEMVLACVGDRDAGLAVLDLGTGSGCLLAALLSELPQAQGLGVDISAAALLRARATCGRLGLGARSRFVCGDFAAPVRGAFDIVVSNPPYIRARDVADLMPDVRDFEPPLALSGGADGLDAYRKIFLTLPDVLRPDGVAVFEFGEGQGASLASLADACSLEVRGFGKDLANRERVLILGGGLKKMLD